MDHPFESICDDFYVNCRLGTQLTLPNNRESTLHLMETLRKQFPQMTKLRRIEDKETQLEEDRNAESYRWASLEAKRLSAGHVNPADMDEALKLHKFLLGLAPHYLGVSPLEIDYLDVLLGFDLGFSGNHDEIVAESLLGDSPLLALASESNSRVVDLDTSLTISLSEDCRLQARVEIVTRTNSYQVRTGNYGRDAISVYLIIRRYWGDQPSESPAEMITQLANRAESLASRYVLPRIVRPLSEAISAR